MLSIQHFLCRPRRRPLSKLPWRMVLERLSWHVTCPKHARFRLLTGARRGCSAPIRWSCAQRRRCGEVSSGTWFRKLFIDHFSESASRVYVSQQYRRMEVPRDLNLLAKLMVLHRHILFSLSIAVIAEVILIRTFAEQVPWNWSQVYETGHLL